MYIHGCVAREVEKSATDDPMLAAQSSSADRLVRSGEVAHTPESHTLWVRNRERS